MDEPLILKRLPFDKNFILRDKGPILWHLPVGQRTPQVVKDPPPKSTPISYTHTHSNYEANKCIMLVIL